MYQMNILFIGDIVGRPGRNAVKKLLPSLKHELNLDLVFANGDNLAAGKGFTYEKYKEMLEVGIDYFTGGDHVFSKKEFWPYLDNPDVKVLRPANYADTTLPGRGFALLDTPLGKLLLVHLQGSAFMHAETTDMFDALNDIVAKHPADMVIVDFHAEATSEKAILGFMNDGKITALLGTHTHVPTADERILPKGTAFQTDIGMTGPMNSSLGAEIMPYYKFMKTGEKATYEVASGPVVFNATLIKINKDGQAESIERVQHIVEN